VIPEGVSQVWQMATKENEDCDDQVHHVVTFDFSGCELDKVLDETCRHLKVKLAQKVRKHMDRFPAGDITVKVRDELSGRGGVVPTKATALAYANTPEKRAELIRELERMADE